MSSEYSLRVSSFDCFSLSCLFRIVMRVGEKRIKADSVHVQETERDTRSARGAGTRKERRRNRETEAERETAITNATDEITAAVEALRDRSITADHHDCYRV